MAEIEFRFERWRRRSVSGAILTGIALGLQEALEPDKERPAIVMPAPAPPDPDLEPLAVYLDPDRPATVAVIRPWLFR